MANLVFNIALGKVGTYVQNVKDGTPNTSNLCVVPLQVVEADVDLRKYDNLGALLSGISDEQSTVKRKYIPAASKSNILVQVDDTFNWTTFTLPDITWSGATAAESTQVNAFVWCYVPNEGASGGGAGTGLTPDSGIIPLTKHDRLWKPDGSSFTLSGPGGFYKSLAA